MNRFKHGLTLSSSDAGENDADINMTPLIDMIFILLIFFLVTASFVKESGVDIQRPSAQSAEKQEKTGLMVGLTADGGIVVDRQSVELRSIRGLVEVFLMDNPGGGVIIEADTMSRTGRLVQVLDQCRLAGAENVAVAAKNP